MYFWLMRPGAAYCPLPFTPAPECCYYWWVPFPLAPRSKTWLCLCQYELLSLPLRSLWLEPGVGLLMLLEEALLVLFYCMMRDALFCNVLRWPLLLPTLSPYTFTWFDRLSLFPYGLYCYWDEFTEEFNPGLRLGFNVFALLLYS